MLVVSLLVGTSLGLWQLSQSDLTQAAKGAIGATGVLFCSLLVGFIALVAWKFERRLAKSKSAAKRRKEWALQLSVEQSE